MFLFIYKKILQRKYLYENILKNTFMLCLHR